MIRGLGRLALAAIALGSVLVEDGGAYMLGDASYRMAFEGRITSIDWGGGPELSLQVGDDMSGWLGYGLDQNAHAGGGDWLEYDRVGASCTLGASLAVSLGAQTPYRFSNAVDPCGSGPFDGVYDNNPGFRVRIVAEAGMEPESFTARAQQPDTLVPVPLEFPTELVGLGYPQIEVSLASSGDAIPSTMLPTTGYDLEDFDLSRKVVITGDYGCMACLFRIECEITSLSLTPVTATPYVSGVGETLLIDSSAQIAGKQLLKIDVPSCNDVGTVAFAASYRDGSDGPKTGIFRLDRDDPVASRELVVANGQVFDGEVLQHVAYPAVNDAGDLFFTDGGRLCRIRPDTTEEILLRAGDTVDGTVVGSFGPLAAADGAEGPILLFRIHVQGGATTEEFVWDTVAGQVRFTRVPTAEGLWRSSINDHYEVLQETGNALLSTYSLDGGATWEALHPYAEVGGLIDGDAVLEMWGAGLNDSGRVVFAAKTSAGNSLSETAGHLIAPEAVRFGYAAYVSLSDAGDVVFLGQHEGVNALFHYRIPNNTSTGDDVEVVVGTEGEARLTFPEVTAEGVTYVSPVAETPSTLPAYYDFKVGSGTLATYYIIDTTATFSGTVTIGLAYDPALFIDESAVKLMHYEGGEWHDITTSVDQAANIVYGATTSFSPFVIAELREPLSIRIDVRPGNAKNDVNPGAQGTLPVAILSDASFDATTVIPDSVVLAGAGVRLKPKGTHQTTVKDVDGDGRDDLLVHVETDGLEVASGATTLSLSARTRSGRGVLGTDVVRVVR